MEDLREAIQLLLDTGADLEDIKFAEIGGRYYTHQNLKEVARKPKAEPIMATTLDAMITYIARCRNEIEGDAMIHIVSPTKVLLMSGLDANREREVLFLCEAIVPKHSFDRWIDQEEFMIYLASCFCESKDREMVLKYAGTVEAQTVSTYGDDGISQKATVSTGVASKAAVILPSRVVLYPFRTFQEIKQPGSAFVFRMNERPSFRLIEADGGTWRLEAMDLLETYILSALEEYGIEEMPGLYDEPWENL